MSQISMNPLRKEPTIPVKFRRNLFEDGPRISETLEESVAVSNLQVYSKPARHMRAQPRASYNALDPEQRRQAELLDTVSARQQLLLRQQQEVLAYSHQQQVQQQAQQLINSSLAVGTTSTTPIDRQLQPHPERQTLNTLLNEACVLAPQSMTAQRSRFPAPGGVGWMPAQPVLGGQDFGHPAISVLANPMTAASQAAPGAPGEFRVMGQNELMQAVRKELKRMQQD